MPESKQELVFRSEDAHPRQAAGASGGRNESSKVRILCFSDFFLPEIAPLLYGLPDLAFLSYKTDKEYAQIG